MRRGCVRRSRHFCDEDGAVAIMYSILMLVIIALVAILLDIGALRVDRRAAQTVVDLASSAGATELQPGGTGGQEACEAAWNYLVQNTTELRGTSPASPCGGITWSCDSAPGTPTVSTTVEPYYVEITWPVPDGHAALLGEDYGDSDGLPCERVGVVLQRQRGFIFGGWITASGTPPPPGEGPSTGITGATGVARAIFGERVEEPAQMLLLDKTGCTALSADGGSIVRVKATEVDDPDSSDPADTIWIKGKIFVDSNGDDCMGTSYTLNAQGTKSRIITEGDDASPPAPGVIWLFAQPAGLATCDEAGHACQQADVDASPPRVVPQPGNLKERTNRTPVEHTFNCKSDYSTLDASSPSADPDLTTPSGVDWDVPECGDATATSAYIDDLVAEFGDKTATTAPAGYNRWTYGPDQLPASGDEGAGTGYTCAPSVDVTVSGNWWVDCGAPFGPPNQQPFNVSGVTVRFTDGNVVLQQGVSIGTGGHLVVNCPTLDTGDTDGDGTALDCIPDPGGLDDTDPCQTQLCPDDAWPEHAFIYIRDGAITKAADGSLTLSRVMTYMAPYASDNPNNFRVQLNSGAGAVLWEAPVEGPFHKLALWSETKSKHGFAGQSALELAGVYFTPNSLTNLAGGSSDSQARAQFFSWRLNVQGGAEVILQPDPDFNLPIQFNAGSQLIR